MSLLEHALVSLDGLSIGDAFGQCFFQEGTFSVAYLQQRQSPPAPWYYTDDTEMALSMVAVLGEFGTIDQGQLARRFAEHYWTWTRTQKSGAMLTAEPTCKMFTAHLLAEFA